MAGCETAEERKYCEENPSGVDAKSDAKSSTSAVGGSKSKETHLAADAAESSAAAIPRKLPGHREDACSENPSKSAAVNVTTQEKKSAGFFCSVLSFF